MPRYFDAALFFFFFFFFRHYLHYVIIFALLLFSLLCLFRFSLLFLAAALISFIFRCR